MTEEYILHNLHYFYNKTKIDRFKNLYDLIKKHGINKLYESEYEKLMRAYDGRIL